jgi:hypothetical protein
MPPKKTKAQLAAEAEEEALLAAAERQGAEAQKKMNEQKAAEKEKALKAEAAEKVKQAAAAKAAAQLPPVLVDEVAAKLAAFARKIPGSDHLRDMGWLSYILHNFMMLCIEKHRRIQLRAGGPDSKPEAIVSFEVRDDPEDVHSWNVITTASGQYAIDMCLEQFLPNGKHGYKRDEHAAEGWQPVKALSRLSATNAPAGTPPMPGTLATDGGVLQDEPVKVQAGVKAGHYKAYLQFLGSAHRGNHRNMSEKERRTAGILNKQKTVPLWLDLHQQLEKAFFDTEETPASNSSAPTAPAATAAAAPAPQA